MLILKTMKSLLFQLKSAEGAEGSLESKVNADVSTEQARAIAAEGVLTTSIATEKSRAKVLKVY